MYSTHTYTVVMYSAYTYMYTYIVVYIHYYIHTHSGRYILLLLDR